MHPRCICSVETIVAKVPSQLETLRNQFTRIEIGDTFLPTGETLFMNLFRIARMFWKRMRFIRAVGLLSTGFTALSSVDGRLPAAQASPDPAAQSIPDRVAAVRARLAEDLQNRPAESAAPTLAQFVNFPNFPNFPNASFPNFPNAVAVPPPPNVPSFPNFPNFPNFIRR
ncbi:MAG: hypothetical protein QOH32_4647 [Bradyrhizobium sp.]|nr:hypothetical protein [Bradyrhizobium sp.]